jgi:voltage-gated potassium channel
LSFPLAPLLFAFVRLARLSRLLRLVRLTLVIGRTLGDLRMAFGRSGLLYVASISAVMMAAGAGMFTILEPETVKGDFWTGVWWAVVTTTTVGYGDVAPVTLEGRLLATMLMLIGLGLMSTLSASIAAYFVRHDAEREEAEIKAVKRQLDEITEMRRQLAAKP